MTSISMRPGLPFIGCEAPVHSARTALAGAPFDGTTSYCPGTRFGPAAIREASWGIETYSPVLDDDLEAQAIADTGDLPLSPGLIEPNLDIVRTWCQQQHRARRRPVLIGGEHLLSWPAIQAAREYHPDLRILHLDAHTDLRTELEGAQLSHATVMRHASELLGPGRILHMGIRSGLREEFEYGRNHNRLIGHRLEPLQAHRDILANAPVYLSLDLDVLDPSIFPGTGTPEPGGIDFREFQAFCTDLCTNRLNIVGADIMELAPRNDPSGVSSLVAAKALREMLLAILTSEHSD